VSGDMSDMSVERWPGGHPLRRSTVQNIELVTKNQDFRSQCRRDRNSPAITHQMNPTSSPIELTIN
jgi:hypothetical protein